MTDVGIEASRRWRDRQLEMFDVTGRALRDEALAGHAARRHQDLARLRALLVQLFQQRRALGYRWPSQSGQPYVTADDAIALAQRHQLGEGASNWKWLGALFRAEGWRWTGDVIESKRASNKARLVRCWRWEGNDAA